MTEANEPRSGFSMGRVGRLARKELSEILRDRRTIVTLVAMPLLLYPVLSVAFMQFYTLSQSSPEKATEYNLGFASGKEAEVFFIRVQQGEAVLRDQADPAKPRPKTPKLNSFLGDAEELKKALAEGGIDARVSLPGAADAIPPNRDQLLHGSVEYPANSAPALGLVAYLERVLTAADRYDLETRLNLPGVPHRTRILTLQRQPIAAVEADSSMSLASLVPLVLILMTITGAVYPAIDLTAGERERGTLEILVAAPVPRFELLSAKYLAVVAVAVLTALVNLVSMALTLLWTGLGRQLFPEGLSPLLFVELFGLLLLFAAFFAAVLLSITSFARSFKEAQAYLIPLMLASLAPGVAGLTPGLKLEGAWPTVPLVNIVLLARDLMNGQADLFAAGIVVVTTALYAGAALSLAARVFGAESVLYSEQSGWADLWRRPAEPRDTASLPAALWCLALMIPLRFALGWLLPVLLGEVPMVQILAIVALSVFLFVGLPALVALQSRVRPITGFRLMPPRVGAVAAGLLLGGSLWPFVLSYLAWAHSAEWLQQVLGNAASGIQTARESLGLLVLLAFVVPAVCEEIFFRGFLFQSMRQHVGPLPTILITSALFGLTHMILGGPVGIYQLLPSTILGVILGIVCWRSGSIWPGLLLHALHNALLFYVGDSDMAKRNEIEPLWYLLGAAGIALATLMLAFVGRPRLSKPVASGQ